MTEEAVELWEILVACQSNDGKPFRTRHHKEWDRQVSIHTGGLTIFKPVKGQWKYEGKLFAERMIPVRLVSTSKKMKKIAKITKNHYDQIAVLYYKIATDVHFYFKDEKDA